MLGLKCYVYEQEFEQDCDEVGGAKYCFTLTWDGFDYKGCATEMYDPNIAAQYNSNPGCERTNYCVCEGNLCNAW